MGYQIERPHRDARRNALTADWLSDRLIEDVLELCAASTGDPRYVGQYVRELWENGQLDAAQADHVWEAVLGTFGESFCRDASPWSTRRRVSPRAHSLAVGRARGMNHAVGLGRAASLQRDPGPERESGSAREPGSERSPATVGPTASVALKRTTLGGVVPKEDESTAAEAVSRVELGSGTALDETTRARLERAFEAPLGDVRVHTDSQAAATVERHGAVALTSGTDIAFAPGAFDPGSPSGDRLLGHEVAHVVQSRAGGLGGGVTPAAHPAEHAADAAGDAFAQGRRVAPGLGSAPAAVSLTRKELTNASGQTMGSPAIRIGQGSGTMHCGPTSTAIILRFLGHNLERDDVVRQTQSWFEGGGIGASQFALVDYLGSLGVQADIWNACNFTHIKTNIDNNIPMIAAIDSQGANTDRSGFYTHYVVIDGYDDVTNEIHITDPGGPSGSEAWHDYTAWARDYWAEMWFLFVLRTQLRQSFITVGDGGTGGASAYTVTPNLQIADGLNSFMRGIAQVVRSFDTVDELAANIGQGTLQAIFGLTETLLGIGLSLPGLVEEWGRLLTDFGATLIDRGGAGNVIAGVLLNILGWPVRVVGAIGDFLADIVARVAEILVAPFRWFFEWLGRDDAVRRQIRERIGSGTITQLDEATVTSWLNELMNGFCGDSDEQAILSLLRFSAEAVTGGASSYTLSNVLTRDMRRRLYSAVDGEEFHELVRLISAHMGNDVRAEVLDELISGSCGDADEASITAIVADLPITDIPTVLTPARRRAIYDAVDGEEFTNLMSAWFIRFPDWRGEIFDRVLETSVGDARERMLLGLVEHHGAAVDAVVTEVPARKRRLYDAVDGEEFTQLMELVLVHMPTWREEAFDYLMTCSVGDAREQMLLRLIRDHQAAMEAVLGTGNRRRALYDAVDGAEFTALVEEMIVRFAPWRGEVLDRCLDTTVGDDRERMLLRLLRNHPTEMAPLLTTARVNRIGDAIDGEEFTSYIGILARSYPALRGAAFDRMLASACGDEREDLMLGIMDGLDTTELDALLTSASRRRAMYDRFDGAQYQSLCRLIGVKASSVAIKVEVIRDLIRGSCGDDDEDSILHILRTVGASIRSQLVAQVTRDELDGALQGTQQDQLDVLLDGP